MRRTRVRCQRKGFGKPSASRTTPVRTIPMSRAHRLPIPSREGCGPISIIEPDDDKNPTTRAQRREPNDDRNPTMTRTQRREPDDKSPTRTTRRVGQRIDHTRCESTTGRVRTRGGRVGGELGGRKQGGAGQVGRRRRTGRADRR